MFSNNGESFLSFVYTNIYGVGVGINTLMSISDRWNQYIFSQKMEKTRFMK